jgi:hypothetical protein
MVVQLGYFNVSIASRHKNFVEGKLKQGIKPRLVALDINAAQNVRITKVTSRFLSDDEARACGGRVCLLRLTLSRDRFPLLTY